MQSTFFASRPDYNLCMETIYVDSLFALNAIIDYFLLLCASKVCGAEKNRWRLAASAVFGGAFAVLSVLPGAGFLRYGVIKLAAALAMCVIAFGGERRLWRCFVVFLAVSAAFGGAVFGASMLTGGSVTGGIYIPVSMKVLAVSFAVCYAAISLTFRRAAKKSGREIVGLRLVFREKSVSLRALRDTGNGLFDPVSGRAVAVAEPEALLPLLPAAAADALAGGNPVRVMEELSVLPGCEGRITLVPYSAIGTPSGLLAAIRPDSVEIDGKPGPGILVAFSPSRLSDDGSYCAII